jgi:hypothetical protein
MVAAALAASAIIAAAAWCLQPPCLHVAPKGPGLDSRVASAPLHKL